MGDIYSDDIEDEGRYPDSEILSDIRSLVSLGRREGLVEYKSDVSPQDNWAETAAAFLNAFGGLIIFGVRCDGDEPREVIGFDPKGVETKARLTSALLSRIQPRPDFRIRVATFDKDATRKVAILRIPEGENPPYMHSKDGKHRICVRVGTEKTDVDYLQLCALFEKRRDAESKASSLILDLTGGNSKLVITQPANLAPQSHHWYRFVFAPDDRRAARPLTRAVEAEFHQCLVKFGIRPEPDQTIRDPSATYFRRNSQQVRSEEIFALSVNGSIGFATHGGYTGDDPTFPTLTFCQRLIEFLILAQTVHETRRYHRGGLIEVSLTIADGTGVTDHEFFERPIRPLYTGARRIHANLTLHPLTAERLQEYVEEIMTDFARSCNSALSQQGLNDIQRLVQNRLPRTAT